eukprot:CAMPEP_0168728480 /NCGR_PEP_ID=MMETSP0724-20121128/5704_1 /TAXON_ID=265536 /ORGANISM="Amphiprora sp., Strain CCMP467" /LENGTH=174 /DNA_ID=CAMNT_0008775323 /DNA_START=6 /DNA_END=530 /DNA_ORIENTATION=-
MTPMSCRATATALFLALLLAITTTRATAKHRADSSKYFLFIEPDVTKKSDAPVDDELTQSLEQALSMAETGTSDYSNPKCQGKFNVGSGYRGLYFSEDGQVSSAVDHRLPNGLITNSLSVHYVRFYRPQIPRTEMKKLKDLHGFMVKKYPGQSQNLASINQPPNSDQGETEDDL